MFIALVALLIAHMIVMEFYSRILQQSSHNLEIDFSSIKVVDTSDAEGRKMKTVIFGTGKNKTVAEFYLYERMDSRNNATILIDSCKPTEAVPGKIELITGFINPVRNKNYRPTIGGIFNRTDVIETRQMEILDVLQDNLLHPVIERVHVLVWENETAEYIGSLKLRNSERLILRIIEKDVGLKEQLVYASECLSDRIVAITNQDNKIGEGWNTIKYHQILKDNDIMYALTRHSPIQTSCTWLRGMATCDGDTHIGSHDTFVFRAKNWRPQVFDELNTVTPDKPGMENLFMWYFKNKLRYRIVNPCKTLYVHHHHCIPIRGVNRPRVNTGGKSMSVDFTDQLNPTGSLHLWAGAAMVMTAVFILALCSLYYWHLRSAGSQQ